MQAKDFGNGLSDDLWTRRLTRRRVLAAGGATLAGASLLAACGGDDEDEPAASGDGGLSGELNLLAWAGWEEAEVLDPFKRQHPNLTINVKNFIGDDEMLALLNQSRGAYDALGMGMEFAPIVAAQDLLAPLDKSQFDLSHYLGPFQDNHPKGVVDGEWYAIIVRWGVNGLSYNTKQLSESDVSSYEILQDPKLNGRIGIWDWYLPSMGTLSAALGNENPYAADGTEFDALTSYMSQIRPGVGAIFPTPAEMLSGLGSGEVWAIPAGADWVSAGLALEGRPVDWTVPTAGRTGQDVTWGGIMWSEGAAMTKDAQNPEAALAWVKYMTTPKAIALMATRKAYWSQVASAKSVPLLSAQAQELLHAPSAAELEQLAERVFVREIPEDTQKWQQAWSRFKAA